MGKWLDELKALKPLEHSKDKPLQENTREQQAITTLYLMAKEFKWPLSDLLDWYSDDLIEISHMEMDVVEFVVKDYIHNIDLCRGEGYQPLGELTQARAA